MTRVCTDCHLERPLEDFRFCHSGIVRNEFCYECGKKRGSTYRLVPPNRHASKAGKRPPRTLEEIPDGYSACLVISDERREEIIRRIEG